MLFPGVTVGAGARVRRSVLLPGATVGPGQHIDSAVVLENGQVQRVEDPAAVAEGART
ncbi:hypothetical protein [Streptomyces tendae]